MRKILALIVVAVFTVVLTTVASAVPVTTTVPINGNFRASATAAGCTNNPGPYITLTGEFSLSGLGGRLIFRNNEKGTHTAVSDVHADVVIIPAGQTMIFNKQPSQGGVGGNPWIYVQLFDPETNANLSDPILMGRCVQGLNPVSASFTEMVAANLDIVTGDCNNSPGPDITINGELRLSGVNARIILTNNANFRHMASDDLAIEVVILPAGQSVTVPKPPPAGGAGGNPWISFVFLDSYGNPTGSEIPLGRCVQMSR